MGKLVVIHVYLVFKNITFYEYVKNKLKIYPKNPFKKFNCDVFKRLLWGLPYKSLFVSFIENRIKKEKKIKENAKNHNNSIIINKNKILQEDIEYDFEEQTKKNKRKNNLFNKDGTFNLNSGSESNEINNKNEENYICTNSEQKEFIENETKQNLNNNKEENIYESFPSKINHFKNIQITQAHKKKKNNEINNININKIPTNINKKGKENDNLNDTILKLSKKKKFQIIKKQLSNWKSSFFSETEKSDDKDIKYKNINETKSMENSVNNKYNEPNNKNTNEEIKIDEIPDIIFSNNLKRNNKFYTMDLNEEESNIDKDIKINIHPGKDKTLTRNCLSDRYEQNNFLRIKSLKED